MLYRVRIGRDEYLGTAEEVIGFLVRAEGAPGRDPASYMEGVAARLLEAFGPPRVPTGDAAAFLDAVRARGVVSIETLPEPSDERIDKESALGDGPVVYGKGVRPEDVGD
jgi:hypothetical protein